MPQFVAFLCALVLVVNLTHFHRLFSADGEWRRYQDIKAQLAEELARNKSIREENDRLRAEVLDLKEGQEILEEIARYDLGLAREGEFFINLVDPAKTIKAPEGLSSDAEWPGQP